MPDPVTTRSVRLDGAEVTVPEPVAVEIESLRERLDRATKRADAAEALAAPEAIRKVVGDDPEIKILVLAAGSGARGPGPLVTAVISMSTSSISRDMLSRCRASSSTSRMRLTFCASLASRRPNTSFSSSRVVGFIA